jgi:HNH endonuclease
LFVCKRCCLTEEEYIRLKAYLQTKAHIFTTIPTKFPATLNEWYQQWSAEFESGLAPYLLQCLQKVKEKTMELNEMDIEDFAKHVSVSSLLKEEEDEEDDDDADDEQDTHQTIDLMRKKASSSSSLLKKKKKDGSVQKYKKKAVPKSVRSISWRKYMGHVLDAPCYCCKTTMISGDSFHAGHVIAEKNGGKATVENIRPICATCNLSMGTRNMHDFMKEHFS